MGRVKRWDLWESVVLHGIRGGAWKVSRSPNEVMRC
jgi:hypothetical protein